MPARKIITRELLEELYIEQRLSMLKIAEQTGWGETTILRRMIASGIPRRPTSPLKYPRNPVPLEKIPYLQGFVEGDLYEYIKSPNTRRIMGSSTKPEWIEHVRGLFQPYGHIGENKRKKPTAFGGKSSNIWVSLDKEDTEVLSKSTGRTKEWVNKIEFLKGLAGYFDADGTVCILSRNNRLRWQIKARDTELLQKITNTLQKIGFAACYFEYGGFGYVRVGNQENIHSLMGLLREGGSVLKWNQYQEKLKEQAKRAPK